MPLIDCSAHRLRDFSTADGLDRARMPTCNRCGGPGVRCARPMTSPHDRATTSEPAPLILQGPRVVLRQVDPTDLPSLLEILREPSVARVWSAPNDEADRNLLLGADPDGAEAITAFAI